MINENAEANSLENSNNMSFKEIIANILVAILPITYIIRGGQEIPAFENFSVITFYIAFFLTFITLLVRKRFRLLRIDYFILLFLFWALAGTLYSPYQSLGLIKWLRFVILGISIIYIIRVLVIRKEQIYSILNIYTLIIFIISINFIISYQRLGLVTRASYLSIAAVAFGYSIGFSILYNLIRFFDNTKKTRVFIFLLAGITSVELYALALNATRGVIVTLIIVILLFFKSYYRNNRKLLYFLISSVTILGIYIIFIYNNGYHGIPIVQRFFYLNKDLSTVYRIELWRKAIMDFLRSPIIGIGTGGYVATIGGVFQKGIYPHNIILEIGAENGIIGILLFSIILYYIIKLYNADKNLNKRLLIQLITYSLIANMFSYSYAINKFFYFSLGLFIADMLLNKQGKEDSL